jgi:hypothetical protein
VSETPLRRRASEMLRDLGFFYYFFGKMSPFRAHYDLCVSLSFQTSGDNEPLGLGFVSNIFLYPFRREGS